MARTLTKSNAQWQRAMTKLPLGVASNFRFWGEDRTIYVKEGRGARITDLDDNHYVDYRLGYGPAWAAVQGWQGDNSVPYRDHGTTCVAIDVAMDSPTSAGPLAAAGRQWALTMPGASVTQVGRRVDLRSCDPGAGAPAPPVISPTAFDVLTARSQIIDQAVSSSCR